MESIPPISDTELVKLLTAEKETLAMQLATMSKEKAAVEKERGLMEKELKSSLNTIRKSKELRGVQSALDEAAKLRNEIEMLGDQKMQVYKDFIQNDSLKDAILATVAKSDSELKNATSLIEVLKKQLLGANIVPEIAPELIPDHTVGQAANCIVLEAKLQAAEKAATEWKSEKIKLQKVIGNLKSEIEEYKIQFEERQLAQPVENVTAAPTAGTSSGWFKSLTISNSTSTGTSIAAPSVESIASTAIGKTVTAVPITNPTVIIETPNDKQVEKPAEKPAEKPVATSSLKSWWSKSTTTQLPAVQPTTQTNPTSPVTSASIPSVDAKCTALEQELVAVKKELQAVKASAKPEELPALPEKQIQEVEKLKQDLVIQSDALKNATDKSAVLEKQLVEARQQVDGTNTQLEVLQAELNTKLKSLIIGEDSVKALESKVTELTALSAEREDFITKLKSDLSQVKTEKERLIFSSGILQKDLINQKQLLIEKSAAFDEQLSKIGTMEIERKLLEANLESMKDDGAGEVTTTSPLESLHAEFQKQSSQLKLETSEIVARKDAEINSLKAFSESIKAEREGLQSKCQELQTKKTEMELILNTQKSEIEGLRSNAAVYTSNMDANLAELQNAQQISMTQKQELENLTKSHALQSKELQDHILKISTLEAQISQLQELSKDVSQKGNEQFTKQILQLGADLEKKNAEIAAVGKKSEAAKQEIESLQKQIKQQKENGEFLVKSLQDQINQLLESKAASDKKIRLEMEEKFKVDKIQIDEKFKKEKTELEEKGKKNVVDCELKNTKERAALEEGMKKDKLKLNQDLDKLRKEYDTLKADSVKRDDLNKATSRIKTLETEISTVKSENQKTIDSLNFKLSELSKDLAMSKEDSLKLVKVKEELLALQTKMELVMQENEVAHSNYERNLKGVTDKDELIKKLKSNREELVANDKLLKANVAKLEKEKDTAILENTALKARIDSQRELVEGAKKNAEGATEKLSGTLKELENQIADLKVENDRLALKVEEINAELNSSNKKSAQMIKDLQKQLVKQKKDAGEEMKRSTTVKSNISEESGIISHENEALIKRAAMFEEQLRESDDHLKKIKSELDQKSKVIQQYVLRDHVSALQPDEKPKKIGINILSSGAAMQKLDPVILSSINLKMQKLLEELTVKNMQMEEELTKLKS